MDAFVAGAQYLIDFIGLHLIDFGAVDGADGVAHLEAVAALDGASVPQGNNPQTTCFICFTKKSEKNESMT